MEISNSFFRNRKRFLNGALVIVFAIMATVLATGCGTKKSGRAAVLPPPPLGLGGPIGCPGCPAGSQFVKSGIGFNVDMSGQPRFELALEFYAAGGDFAYGGGQVYAAGTLRVHRLDYGNPCIPVGTYTVRSATPGQIGNYGDSFAVTLEALGPARLAIELRNNFFLDETPPALGSDGKSYPFTIWNPMIVQVQAGACSGVQSFSLERLPYR